MDYEEAIKKFEEVLEKDPDNAGLWCSWGVALMELGKYADAAEKFETAVTKKEDFAAAWFGWGFALMAQGQKKEAAEKMKKALEIDPNMARDLDTGECLI